MDIKDFVTPCGEGLCCTTDFKGEELVLSQCFVTGVHGVRKAVDMVISANSEGGTIPHRYGLILTMAKAEARSPSGMRMTNAGNGVSATIKREWGISRNLRRNKVPVVMELVLGLAQLQLEHNRRYT
jgi:hypothetical protein